MMLRNAMRGYRPEAPASVLDSSVVMQLTGQIIVDCDPAAVAQHPYDPWPAHLHEVPHDKYTRSPYGKPDTASCFLFGVTSEGHTVTVRVVDPQWPVHFRLHDAQGVDFDEGKIAQLQGEVRKLCGDNTLTFKLERRYQCSGFVEDVEAGPVDGRPVRKRLLFGRLLFRSCRSFDACKRITKSRRASGCMTWRPEEIDVGDLVNKFMDYMGWIDSGWVEVTRFIHRSGGRLGSMSHDDIDLMTRREYIKNVERVETAPLRYVSIDIETHTKRRDHLGRRRFCDPKQPDDRVIQIGLAFGTLGRDEPGPRVVLCLGETANDVAASGVHIVCFDEADEAGLLGEFARLVSLGNVRCLMGYNLYGFDYPYLIERAKRHRVHSFWYMSPITAFQTSIRTYKNRRGQDVTNLEIPGTYTLDVMERIVALPGTEFPSYKLNAVAKRLLSKSKVDLDIEDMMDLWARGPEERARIAQYCIVDCDLPIELANKLDLIRGLMQLSAITHNTVEQLVSRGTVAFLKPYAAWVAHRHGYVLTTMRLDGSPMDPTDDTGTKYEGGMNFEPTRGLHRDVHVLDFASLYPSIIHSWNLCWSSWVYDPEHADRLQKMPLVDAKTHDVGGGVAHAFVANAADDNDGRGLIPIMVSALLRERKTCRARMKLGGVSSDEMAVLEVRQQQVKVVANSMYGFTGARGDMACVAVAATTTALGRELVKSTKTHVEAVSAADGGAPVFEVVYGDTDSVFVKKVAPAPEWEGPGAMDRLAEQIDDQLKIECGLTEATQHNWIVHLENEGMYNVLVLYEKKQYIALQGSKRVLKGVAIKRADMCPFARGVVEAVTFAVVEDCAAAVTPEGGVTRRALELLGEYLMRLRTNGLSYDKATVSNKLSEPPPPNARRVDIKQPHALVAYDHRVRTGTPMASGDRVPYVLTIVTDDAKKKSRGAQCPREAARHKVPLDLALLLESQIVTPLQRFLKPFDATCVTDLAQPYVDAFRVCQRRQHDQHWRDVLATCGNNPFNATRRLGDPSVTWSDAAVNLRADAPSTPVTKRLSEHEAGGADPSAKRVRAGCIRSHFGKRD